MKTLLKLNPKYWFGEKVWFDSRGRKGLGIIRIISLSQHNEISYEILVDDEPYDIQGGVFENEIVSTENNNSVPGQIEIRPRFSFGHYVLYLRSHKRVKGYVCGISIDDNFNCYCKINMENSNIYTPMVPENEILPLKNPSNPPNC